MADMVAVGIRRYPKFEAETESGTRYVEASELMYRLKGSTNTHLSSPHNMCGD
jgi:hypothetical protein